MIDDARYNTKLDELTYIDDIIANLTRLKRLYTSDILQNTELAVVEQILPYWWDRQEKVNGKLNDLKGY